MTVRACTILVVDDDFDVRDTLSDILTDEGLRVATAEDGQDALRWLESNPAPCLILLDLMMPRCDGAQFRAQQRSLPALSAIPVVLLTANARAGEKMAATEGVECLLKPIKLEQLLEVVERYCGRPLR